MPVTQIQFPEKLSGLFRPYRYKIIRGGRGSTKSWSVARALIIKAAQGKLQVLCAREFQSSIRDSVHKLLSNQIAALGLSSVFDIQQTAIYGPHESVFVFVGLSDKTAESLKSYEDFDIVWVEEGQVLSQRSIHILTPTIRKDGSEIWITFNPELDTDPTWVEFVENATPESTFGIEMNWRDNPWFNAVLEAERQKALRTMSRIDYENIWEGKPRPAVSGAIYSEEVAKLVAEGRIGEFPHDPHLMTHAVFDLGWNDKMSIIMVQRVASSLRAIDYIEDDHKTLDWYSRELRKREYNWGTLFLPHDGGHGNAQTGKTDQQILEDLKWTVTVLPNQAVDNGIRAARMAFEGLYVNKSKCGRLVECLKRYRRGIPATTGEPGAPVHDEWSHGADAYRYTALAAPMMDNHNGLSLPALKYPKLGVV